MDGTFSDRMPKTWWQMLRSVRNCVSMLRFSALSFAFGILLPSEYLSIVCCHYLFHLCRFNVQCVTSFIRNSKTITCLWALLASLLAKVQPSWLRKSLKSKTLHFPKWQQKGITHLHHIFENHEFMSLSTIIQKFGIGRDQFLHYQQLKSLIKSKMKWTNNTLQLSKTSEQLLDIANHPK